jgi:hypothetical protein
VLTLTTPEGDVREATDVDDFAAVFAGVFVEGFACVFVAAGRAGVFAAGGGLLRLCAGAATQRAAAQRMSVQRMTAQSDDVRAARGANRVHVRGANRVHFKSLCAGRFSPPRVPSFDTRMLLILPLRSTCGAGACLRPRALPLASS